MVTGQNQKRALITGITGQDGSYLAELLLAKGYKVHGLIRRASNFNTQRIDHLMGSDLLELHFGDLSDHMRLVDLVGSVRPHEIYNLAAQSHVRVSFDEPVYTSDVVGSGVLALLEAVRIAWPEAKFYQASSSEMFGAAQAPQSMETPFAPQSPYATAKLMSHWNAKNYREGYGLFVASGILFNHESPRRGRTFVTKKIAEGVAKIHSGQMPYLYLGNLNSKRDWGYAPDYVVGMWRMMQMEKPKDVVLATGVSTTVGDFLSMCFGSVGLLMNFAISTQ
jgi:GDPmannose 4,6-dehydratase